MARRRDVLRLREKLERVIDSYFQKDLEQLSPKDRATILVQLIKYVLPQLKAVEHSGEVKQKITHILPADIRKKLELNGSDNNSR